MALLATLRRGDTVVIWRLDKLGRSLKDLIYLVPAPLPHQPFDAEAHEYRFPNATLRDRMLAAGLPI